MISATQILESLLQLIRFDERNVVNVDEIERYITVLTRQTNNSHIKNWLESTFRKYLINVYSRVIRVDPLDNSYSHLPWITDVTDRGEDIYRVVLPVRLDNQIKTIIAYFEAVLRSDSHLPNRLVFKSISSLSFLTALAKAEDWDSIERSKGSEEGEYLILKLGDGFNVCQIASTDALRREGDRNLNCVGCYSHDVAKNRCKVYSLRDRENHPHCTILAENKKVTEIRGYANGPVKPQHRQYVVDFLNYGLDEMLFTDIVIDILEEFLKATMNKGVVELIR
jgi:hypothetical protein